MILTSQAVRNDTGSADTLLVPAPTESDTAVFAGVLSEYGEPQPEATPDANLADVRQSDTPVPSVAQVVGTELSVDVNAINADLIVAGVSVETESLAAPVAAELTGEVAQTVPVLQQLAATTVLANAVLAVSGQVEQVTARWPLSAAPATSLSADATAETVTGLPGTHMQVMPTTVAGHMSETTADMRRTPQVAPVATAAAETVTTATTVTPHAAPKHLTEPQGISAATMLQERRDMARDGGTVDSAAPGRAVTDLTMASAVDADSETGERRRATALLAPVTSTDIAVRTTAEQNAISQREPQAAVAAPAVTMPMMAGEDWAESLAPRLLQFGMVGGGRMTVQLHPAELGTMEVALEVDRDDVRVSFVVNQGNARELLDSHTPRLRDMLAAQGFENVEVDISGGRDEDAGEANERKAGSTDQDVSSGDAPGDDATAALSATAPASDRLVDAYA